MRRMIQITSWNRNSRRFLHAPIFEWSCAAPAKVFRIEISPRHSSRVFQIETSVRRADFSRVWPKLPLTEIGWTITALDRHGHPVDASPLRRFFKADGRFVPARKHADWLESAERNVRFLLTAKGVRRPLHRGEVLPPWSVHCNFDPRLPVYVWHAAFMEGEFLHEAAFPCLHYPWFIRLFLAYSLLGRDPKLRRQAAQQAHLLGKLLRRFSWPASYRCGGLPCTSIGLGKFGASTEGRNYGITRASWAGSALLELADATGESTFLDHAWHIAHQLLKFQRQDGSFPMRVDPKTGRVTAAYTTAGIAVAMFFDECQSRATAGGQRWRKARDKAVAWVLANPVRTQQWDALFEDVGVHQPFANLANLEALQTIRYLAAHAGDDSSFVPAAERIHDWVEDQFVVFGRDDSVSVRPPVPSVLEQFACPHPMEVHTAHWLLALVALHRVTGKQLYRDKAVAAANAITQFQLADGRYLTFAPDVVLGRPFHRYDWFGCNALAAHALLQFARPE